MSQHGQAASVAVQPSIRFSREQSFLGALILVMIMLNYLDRQALSVVAPVMRKELGLSTMQYAYAVNAFLLSYSLMYTGSGMILDRIGYRVGLAAFVTLWSIFSASHAMITGLWSLLLCRFLLGLAEPAGFTGAVKMISERFQPAQRSLATGLLNVGSGLGSLIAPPVMVFLTLHYGWRNAFFFASCVGLLWVPFWMSATKARAAQAAPVERSRKLSETFHLLRDRRVIAYLLTRLFGDSSGYFAMFWIPEYLVSSKHFSFNMIGTLGWIPPCGADLGAIVGGYLSSRLVLSGRAPVLSRKIMMTLAAVLLALGACMQAAESIVWVLISLSICTFAVGMWACNLHALATDAFPRPMVATVHGMAGSAGSLAGIGFNTLVGYFSSRHEYGTVILLFAMLLPCAVTPLWVWMSNLTDEEVEAA